MATMTAAQKREQARAEYDAFLKDCPTHQLLGRLSEKWTLLVVAALAEGSMRYSDLSRRIAGVSPKMLTQSLRSLERDGILTRTVTPSVPVRVDYEITELGASLAQLMTGVKEWAETHIKEVHEARVRYDAGDRYDTGEEGAQAVSRTPRNGWEDPAGCGTAR